MNKNAALPFIILVGIVTFLSCHRENREGKLTNPVSDVLFTADSIVQIYDSHFKACEAIDSRALKGDTLAEKHIVIDKVSCLLYLRENGQTLMRVPVCPGIGIGQKTRIGDHRTPEGEYKIVSIEDPTNWTHDFRDGRGPVKGSYGPWFFRLNCPQSTQIGIHGTDRPESLGKRESEGCIRMSNDDVMELRNHVTKGMKVFINPDTI